MVHKHVIKCPTCDERILERRSWEKWTEQVKYENHECSKGHTFGTRIFGATLEYLRIS